MTGWGLCSYFNFLNQILFIKNPVVFNRFQIQLDCFLYVFQGFFFGFAFADATWQGRRVNGVAAFVTFFKNDFESHVISPSLLLITAFYHLSQYATSSSELLPC